MPAEAMPIRVFWMSQPGWKVPPLGKMSMWPTDLWMPMLRSGEPLVLVCRTSTNLASSWDRMFSLSACSKVGPAGSSPAGGEEEMRREP